MTYQDKERHERSAMLLAGFMFDVLLAMSKWTTIANKIEVETKQKAPPSGEE